MTHDRIDPKAHKQLFIDDHATEAKSECWSRTEEPSAGEDTNTG